MAKYLRKMVAWIMILSLCASIITLPAAAEEEEAQPATTTTTVTGDITDGSGNVIGTITTKTETTTTDTSKNYSETTKTDTSYSSEQQTGSSSSSSGDTTTTGNEVTQITGSEQTVQSMDSNKQTGVETHSGSTTGSEDTTIINTVTTTTTTTNDLQADATSSTTTKTKEEQQGEWSDYTQVGEDGQWDKTGESSTGYQEVSGTKETTTTTSGIDVDTDPLKNDDAQLNMTAGGKTASDKLFITIEDALANDITYTEGKQADGSTVTFQRDKDGNVTGYTITKETTSNGTASAITETGSGSYVASGTETKTYVKPEGYTPVENEAIVEDGETVGTRTVTEILDGNNNVIGYEITEVRTDTTPSTADTTTTAGTTPDPVRTLPERPVAPKPTTDQYGMTTTVTVEDIVENGVVVGYKTSTTVTDSQGNEVSYESESIYGSVTTYSSSVEKDPESEVVTTTTVTTVYGTLTTQNYTQQVTGTDTTVNTKYLEKDQYQLVNTGNGLYFLYQGQMYAVEEINDHGKISMSTVTPNLSLTPSGDGSVSEKTDLRNPHYNESALGKISKGYQYQYVGYGLESAIQAQTGSNSGTLVHQFKLVDAAGNAHYVLCADFNTTAIRNTDYSMENVVDADYYSAANAKKIQAIVYNGYWGTSSGVGSLEDVKNFLKENSNLSDDMISKLTPGEALTATQAALWYYGHSSGTNPMSATDAAYKEYTGTSNGNGYWYLENLSDEETTLVNALYKALINQKTTNADDYSTELIDTGNFAKSANLVIKEKAVDSSTGKVKTDSKGNEKYVTDLTFTLDVQKSDLTGNLKIYVKDEKGNVLAERQLATDDSGFVGNLLAEDSVGSGTYTIKDIELAEGVKFSLNIEGTQNLALGAYLYSAEVYSTSQTFVGLGSGTHQVDLQVDMEFSVTDPQAQVKHTDSSWTEKETVTGTYTRTDNYKRTREGTETDQVVTVNTKVYGTTVQTDIATTRTDEHRQWRSQYEYKLTVTDEEEKKEEQDEEKKKWDEILDEEVPLAAAPKTGDISLIWMVLSLMAAGGLAVVNRKKEI